jgi:hypothetical protein
MRVCYSMKKRRTKINYRKIRQLKINERVQSCTVVGAYSSGLGVAPMDKERNVGTAKKALWHTSDFLYETFIDIHAV